MQEIVGPTREHLVSLHTISNATSKLKLNLAYLSHQFIAFLFFSYTTVANSEGRGLFVTGANLPRASAEFANAVIRTVVDAIRRGSMAYSTE